jgi:prolyl-tRNA synthetase
VGRGLADGKLELKDRRTGAVSELAVEHAVAQLTALVNAG